MDVAGFWKSQFQCTKFTIWKRNSSPEYFNAVAYGPYGGGSWLREDKKLLCGMEWKNVVAYGYLPSPARLVENNKNRKIKWCQSWKL